MIKRIREGSSGVWDKTPMPTHTELTKQETQKMVQWIMQNAADPNNSYYTGTEGTFRIQSTSALHHTAYMLTASYTDHGTKDDSTHRLKGQDAIIIQSK
jgi:cytochrome c